MRRVADLLAQDPADWLWRTFWQMVTRRVQLHVGELDFHGAPDSQGVVEFGYMVRPLHRNHGYATEAARALVDWALSQPGVTAVRAETDRDNLASQRVLQKLGALPDGDTPQRLWWRISRLS
jgi:RimJ/RimL family protein N-acetyltransferase